MPTHKINIQTNKNGLWTINDIDSDVLHAFVRFYNALQNDYPKHDNSRDTKHPSFVHSIIIDNQTGQVIPDPFK